MDIDGIFSHNKEWISEKLSKDPQFFNTLATGQDPSVLYIGCSDSRVTAEEILGAEQGEVFVHRNIANVVANTDLSIASVVEYAVSHLGVKYIIVCGHYACGGVKAAMSSIDLGILNPWLRNIRDVYRLHKQELNAIKDDEVRFDRLVELNVKEQCFNIIKIASVQKAHRERELQVFGWVFDVKTGKLIDQEIDFDKELQNIMDIYLINRQ